MWTVIYMAQDMETAEKVKEVLTKEGFLVKLRPLNKKIDKKGSYCEILVPKQRLKMRKVLLLNMAYNFCPKGCFNKNGTSIVHVG